MRDRRQGELKLLRTRYDQIEAGEDSSWILVARVGPLAGWNRSETEVLFDIPQGYPVTPPDNFWVPEGLRTQSGALPGNYSEPVERLGRRWGQFSFHVQEWSPSADLADGHNLLTFMLGVETRLREAP